MAAWRCGLLLAVAGAAAAADDAAGDASKGKATYETICAVCHGGNGEGGQGLPLKGIAQRLSVAETLEKIRNPRDPMPRLFPAVLSEEAVRDVAAFVRTLK